MVLFVNSQYPAQSVADLVAAAKAKPGTIGCALSGVGGVSHLTLELFKLRANVNLLPVPYRGAAIGLADVAGGTVPAIFSTLAAAKPLLDGGRVRALAVALDVYTVADELWRRGWYVDRQGPPPSLHCTVNAVHDGKIAAFAVDLRAAVDGAKTTGAAGARGAYGTVD